MSEHFIMKSKIEAGQPVRLGDAAVIEKYPELQRILSSRAGDDVARIFAEPFANWGNDVSAITVSWYCDAAGTARRLSALEPDEREAAEAKLTAALTKASALIDGSEDGKLVAGALSVASPDDVMMVGSQPILVNWGMQPVEGTATTAEQNAHFSRSLGRFLPLAAAPVLFATGAAAQPPAGTAAAAEAAAPATDAAASSAANAAAGTPASADMAAQTQGAAAAGGGAGGEGPGGGVVAPQGQEPVRRAPIWPVAILALVLAVVAIWLLLPGTRLFPDDRSDVARGLDDTRLELIRRLNEDLEERARVLEAALEGAVCTPEGTLLLPDGRLPEGILPDPSDASISPTDTGRGPVIREGRSDALVPPDPSRITVPDAPRPEGDVAEAPSEGGGTADEAPNLIEVIEQRTVLVISQAGDGLGVGTGFFIAPNLVATNHHVIENALAAGDVFVTNTDLGSLRPASIVQADGPFEDTLADFAILRVPDVSAPYFQLGTAPGSLKLQNVIAAGYPTDIMGSDFRFQQLLEGETSSVPDLIVTDGIVNTEQAVSATRSMLVHSAPISKGNSGGPLVDTCGRVVGMNTFVREETFRNLNIAQANQNLLEFLSGAGVELETAGEACVPRISRVSVPRDLTIPEAAPSDAAEGEEGTSEEAPAE